MYRDFAEYGRLLFEQGLNNSHSGNMSMRVNDRLLITRHGARLGALSPRDIVTVGLVGDDRDARASYEVAVHRAAYRALPSLGAIVHAHNPHAIALSLMRRGTAIKPIDQEGAYYLPVIPILRCRTTIASDEVARKLPALIGKHKACIVAGHGVFAGGGSLEEATMFVTVVESACRIAWLAGTAKG